MRLTYAPAARRDITGIRRHIARDNRPAANEMVERLLAACRRLARFPGLGRPGREPGTREFSAVRPYVIVYRPLEDEPEIVRIWHAAQDRSSGD